MDIFVEQLVARENSPGEKFFRIFGIILLGLMAGISLVGAFAILPPQLSFLGLLIAAGLCYLAYYLNGMFNVEYEYILTNGDLDIDTILNRKKRKRLASFDCKNVESFYKFDKSKLNNSRSLLFVGNQNSDDLYCIDVTIKSSGKSTVVFEPNEKLFSALMKCLPRQIVANVQNRH